MGIGGALESGLSGLTAFSSAISMHTDNIVNEQSEGHRATDPHFLTLVTNSASTVGYSSGGVRAVGTVRTADGNLSATGGATDTAITGGKGMMVVNSQPDGSGTTYFTRAGSFKPNQDGVFVNSAGYTLMAWPLDSQGRIPGAPGNQNTTSSALIDSLVPVNISTISGAASATTKIDFQVILNEAETILQGAGETIQFPISNPVNYDMTLGSIIVPTANLHVGDDLVVTTPVQAYNFTYGGFTVSNPMSGGLFGVTLPSLQFNTGITPGDTFTISTPTIGTLSFSFVTQGTQAALGEFSTMTNLLQAIETSAAGKLNASYVGGQLYIAPVNANEAMTITDTIGHVASTLGIQSTAASVGTTERFCTMSGLQTIIAQNDLLTLGTKLGGSTISQTLTLYNANPLQTVTFGGRVSSYSNLFAASDTVTSNPVSVSTPVLGATSPITNFTGAANNDHFSITVNGATTTYTYVTGVPAAGQFNTLTQLSALINATAGLSSSITGSYMTITPTGADVGEAMTFTNGAGTFLTALNLTNTTNILGAATTAGIFSGAANNNNFTISDGLGNSQTLTYTTGAYVAGAGKFTNLIQLSAEINAGSHFTSYIEGNRLYVKPVLTQTALTFTDNAGTIAASLGFTSNPSLTNILTEFGLTAGTSGPAYDPQGLLAPNMAGGRITPHYQQPFSVYDSFGQVHNFRISFLKIGINTWSIEMTALEPAEVVLSGASLATGLVDYGTATFNGDGTLQSITGNIASPMILNWNNQALTSTITLNWGTQGAASNAPANVAKGGTNGLSQPKSAYDAFIQQDGVPSAGQDSVYTDENGNVVIRFLNGLTRNAFLIPLASFSAPDALQSMDGNVYAQTTTAGGLNLRQAGVDGVGTFRPGYVEQSNVDLADELTALIKCQRGYESCAQTISVTNDLLKQLNNLFR